MPQTTIDLLNKGTQANVADSFRQGNIIALPDSGSVIVTGDLHGHRRNLERIITYADLANNADRHVILHEIVHGGPEDEHEGCISYRLVFEAIRYSLEFPGQVHFILGNHDTACITNADVMKNGKEMNRSMCAAIGREFGEAAEDVTLALRRLLFSQALGVRTGNRVWISHSLPADNNIDKFDAEVFERQLKITDIVRPGPAYLLTWGRRHSQAALGKLGELLDVDQFILGHQPQPDGWKKAGDNLIILASDHNHGCILPIQLDASYTCEQLIERIVPLTSIE